MDLNAPSLWKNCARRLNLPALHPHDPTLTMIYTALLTDYRRIRAHALNVHEATAGTGESAD